MDGQTRLAEEGRINKQDYVQRATKRRLDRGKDCFEFSHPPSKSTPLKPNNIKLPSLHYSHSKVYSIKNVEETAKIINIPANSHIELFDVNNSAVFLRSSELEEAVLCQGGFFQHSIIFIYCNGPVSLAQVKNLILVITSHQLRLNHVTNSIILSHTTSNNVLVENINEVSFGSIDGDQIIEPQYVVSNLSCPRDRKRGSSLSNFFGKRIQDLLEQSPEYKALDQVWKQLPFDSLTKSN